MPSLPQQLLGLSAVLLRRLLMGRISWHRLVVLLEMLRDGSGQLLKPTEARHNATDPESRQMTCCYLETPSLAAPSRRTRRYFTPLMFISGSQGKSGPANLLCTAIRSDISRRFMQVSQRRAHHGTSSLGKGVRRRRMPEELSERADTRRDERGLLPARCACTCHVMTSGVNWKWRVCASPQPISLGNHEQKVQATRRTLRAVHPVRSSASRLP